MRNPSLTILLRTSFFVSALLFWWAMLHPHRRGYGVSAGCLFATSLIGGALGALMSLSSSPWYVAYAAMGMTGVDPNGAVDEKDLQRFQDYFLKAGTQKTPIELSQLVDTSFLNAALQRVGPYKR